ncbi:unnamed protein product (macronuclear) [Paramecium tetraurelia]|uniref:Transmembrane protein n=1 Tax=Paramecium tetraurelia TaxID=5888 RepID=A0CI57_PARTE|nr:uncharacterized protein GSPATT00038578001 [Paramecium tetraurelia]CAK70474.1 unnamed protein product [Paramecium tetraurelia]|eukprot:XP_001437871.1 hypothetical protein (macronuclear) [Paramecium tetraurelia strain d4-2]
MNKSQGYFVLIRKIKLTNIQIQKQTQTRYCQNTFNCQEYNPIHIRALFILVDYITLSYITQGYQQELQNLLFLEQYQDDMEKESSGNIQSYKFYVQLFYNIFFLWIATQTKRLQQYAYASKQYQTSRESTQNASQIVHLNIMKLQNHFKYQIP